MLGTCDSIALCHFPEVEEEAGPHDGGHRGSQQEPSVDSTNILGAVQISLDTKYVCTEATIEGERE